VRSHPDSQSVRGWQCPVGRQTEFKTAFPKKRVGLAHLIDEAGYPKHISDQMQSSFCNQLRMLSVGAMSLESKGPAHRQIKGAATDDRILLILRNILILSNWNSRCRRCKETIWADAQELVTGCRHLPVLSCHSTFPASRYPPP
jgi:hypothetical protein